MLLQLGLGLRLALGLDAFVDECYCSWGDFYPFVTSFAIIEFRDCTVVHLVT